MDLITNATTDVTTTVVSCHDSNSSDQQDSSNCSDVTRFVDIYIVTLLCFVGIIGNVLSIAVLGRDRTMRRSTAFLLQVVAVADAAYLTACLFIQTANTITVCTDWFTSLKRSWPHMAPIVWPCASIAQTCTVWLVVVLTADRYVAICKPLHAGFWITTPRIRKVVFIVVVFAFLYNIPRFFEREVVQYTSCANEIYYKVNKSEFRENIFYVTIYKTACYFLLRYFIPLSLLVFFNCNLIRAIRRSTELQRRGSSNASVQFRERRQYTLILIVIVLVFVLCGLPDFILRIYITVCAFLGRKPTGVPFFRDMNTFSNLCLTINSCINFVIYCLLGGKFRRILCCMCCALCVDTKLRYQPVNQAITMKHATLKTRHNAAAQTSCELLTNTEDDLYN